VVSGARVSVVIPAWNAGRYLGAAIESVLSQSCPPAEVIVVDDGSTDDTADVASRHPVTLIRQPNQGAGVARNAGVAATTSPLLAFLDADDLWLPEKQARQLAAMEATGADAVFGLAGNFVSPDRAEELAGMRVDTTVRAAYLPSALLVRRAALEAVGPFATGGALTDWVDWYLRLVELPARIHVVDAEVVGRRVHGDNATLTDPAGMLAYTRLLKASLDRRRAKARVPTVREDTTS
jgi:glycosyltransferase involved in cell wall biosynthesis